MPEKTHIVEEIEATYIAINCDAVDNIGLTERKSCEHLAVLKSIISQS
jgi:hypothetical protein